MRSSAEEFDSSRAEACHLGIYIDQRNFEFRRQWESFFIPPEPRKGQVEFFQHGQDAVQRVSISVCELEEHSQPNPASFAQAVTDLPAR